LEHRHSLSRRQRTVPRLRALPRATVRATRTARTASMRRLLSSLLPSAAAAAAAAPARRLHRPFAALDADAIRPVGGGRCIADRNPGIRVTLDVVRNAEEEAALVAELRALETSHGFASSVPQRALAGTASAGLVAPVRVTGRPELLPVQRLAPWGYGDAFDASALPPALAALTARVASGAAGGLALGPLRDVTVNYRTGAHFKLDPHVDPLPDGENVCVIGLLSDTVLTFVPPDALARIRAGGASPERRSAEEVARRSWSRGDLDALLKRRAMVHMCGDARWRWGHAIRAGVLAPQPQGADVICDWWGSMGVLLRRAPQRVSIVLAFADVNGAEAPPQAPAAG
jgi:hypothetical protein